MTSETPRQTTPVTGSESAATSTVSDKSPTTPQTPLKTISGAAISPLCFGTMQFGGTADDAMSEAMFEACRAAGLNFFDTAYVYTEGRSERLLGRFAQDARETLYIATKAAYSRGTGRDTLISQVGESRKRLRMDYIDLLYLHRWDPDTPLEESFETLATLQSQGVIRHIGLSNFAAWQVMKAAAVADRFATRIDMLQPMYSLVKRQAEVEILPMAQSEGFAIAPYSPLGGDLLTGKYASGGTGRLSEDTRYAARYGQAWMHECATRFAALAAEHGTTPASLAVAWVAAHPAVTAPIISARSTTQLAPSLAALDMPLEAALYEAIEALSPRPAPATDRLEEA